MPRNIVTILTILLIAFTFTSVPATKGIYSLTIELLQSVYFLTPEGEEVMAKVGTYEVDEAESGLY